MLPFVFHLPKSLLNYLPAILAMMALILTVFPAVAAVHAQTGSSSASCAAASQSSTGTSGPGVGSWTSSCYPATVIGASCVTSAGDMYCVGGDMGSSPNGTTSVFFTSISSGVASWSATTSYPISVTSASCATSGGYIYCVAGDSGPAYAQVVFNSTYYAQLSSSGVGQWTETTSYPIAVTTESCSTSGGYIYCVGGDNEGVPSSTSVLGAESAAYYAQISSAGIGAWKQTTDYPVTAESPQCTVSGSYLYCIGGYSNGAPNSSGTPASEGEISSAYYAPVSSSGLGGWTQTTSYPIEVYYHSCVSSDGYAYCVGGLSPSSSSSLGDTDAVYYAPESSSGLGQWVQTTSYPVTVYGSSCSSAGDDLYCVGGETNVVSCAQIGGAGSAPCFEEEASTGSSYSTSAQTSSAAQTSQPSQTAQSSSANSSTSTSTSIAISPVYVGVILTDVLVFAAVLLIRERPSTWSRERKR